MVVSEMGVYGDFHESGRWLTIKRDRTGRTRCTADSKQEVLSPFESSKPVRLCFYPALRLDVEMTGHHSIRRESRVWRGLRVSWFLHDSSHQPCRWNGDGGKNDRGQRDDQRSEKAFSPKAFVNSKHPGYREKNT